MYVYYLCASIKESYYEAKVFANCFFAVPLLLVGCSNNPGTSGSSTSSGGESKSDSGTSSKSVPPSEDVIKYRESLKNTSTANHLYVHYYRFNKDYDDWDIWSWAYKPSANEGYRFDWKGRTTNSTHPEQPASGTATLDPYSYACCDIDLTQKFYNGGWDNDHKTIGGTDTCFYQYSIDPVTNKKVYSDELDTQIGVQIVKSDTRIHGTGQFWENDGSNLYLKLEEWELDLPNDEVCWHVFVNQDDIQNPSLYPTIDAEDPFINDDGTNVTYGDDSYNNVNWSDKQKAPTAKGFLYGQDSTKGDKDFPLENGAGVGYQIMVSSFADSDGDGSGDILGITRKVEDGYFDKLGVNVLWLTPIQLSDSYHGYDISDYVQVDPKFGSKESEHVEFEEITSASAMEDYKDLLNTAHEHGMVVVMDLVLNHTSTTNKWYISSAQLDDETRGYYQWGNHETQSEIKVENYWYPYGSHVYSYYAKFGSSMPELNYAYQSTRDAVKDMALYWLELGVDGFRMDAVKHIFLQDEVKAAKNDTVVYDISEAGNYSSNMTKNINFWKELNHEIKSLYPNAFFVGENFDGHAYHVAPYYEGFDSLFDFYTYFNLTSIAAKSNLNGGGSSSAFNQPANKFLGDYNYSGWKPDDLYSASKDLQQGNITATTSLKYGGNWNLREVYSAQNQYRSGKAMNSASSTEGYDMIAGNFTSNHDIARSINRIAGTNFTMDGVQTQGKVTTSNYAKLDKLATCVQIAQLMLPGVTWIYYGDELGMTGNFPQGKDANSPYADLWYRQPMKWVESGKVGDGSMTCGYGVTGSAAVVEWDDVNKSSTVKSAATQVGKSGSHFESIAAFAKEKSNSATLIRGNFVPYDWGSEQYVINFLRKLGNETYHIVVNLGSNSLTAGLTGTVKASYNGATLTKIPAYSAILIKD